MRYGLLFINFLFVPPILPRAITFDLNGGRFGDNLSTYCKAKYYARQHKLKLLYKPFKDSDQLTLHTIETLYTPELKNSFDKIIRVKTEKDITDNKDDNILFVSDFYSQTPGLYEYGFRNSAFAAELKKMLTPIKQLPPLEKNDNSITVALHVRKGGGFDKPLASDQENVDPNIAYADKIWPTKFPPDSYYIEQIKTMRRLISAEKSIIIHLFTDDPNPASIAQKYAQALNDSSITFAYRHNGNNYDHTIVEDFYYIAQCDCLIRSSSLFATAAQLLGNHTIIMYPIYGVWQDNKAIINPVGIIMRTIN